MSNLVLILSLINIVSCYNPLINLKDGCRIETTEGIIDLSQLGNSGVVPRFKDQGGPEMLYTYSFNPCTGFTEALCRDVAICQTLTSTGQNFVLGYPYQVQFKEVSGHSGALVYTATSEISKLRTSTVTLTCQPDIEGQLIVKGENPQLFYSFELVSKYACPVPNPTTAPPYQPTSVTRGPPHPQPQPVPGIFSLKTSVILLFSIQFTLVIIIILLLIAVIGMMSRRNSQYSSKNMN